jgi:hypothetical protein
VTTLKYFRGSFTINSICQLRYPITVLASEPVNLPKKMQKVSGIESTGFVIWLLISNRRFGKLRCEEMQENK